MRIRQEGDIFIAMGNEEEFICCICKNNIEVGAEAYLCKNIKGSRCYCRECQDEWNEKLIEDLCCKHEIITNKEDGHHHVKFIRRTEEDD